MMRENVLLQLLGFGACLWLAPVQLLAGDVPGSAAVPPKTLSAPNPPAPSDGRASGMGLLLWIRADGTVEEAEFVRGDRDWFAEISAAMQAWRFEPVMADGRAIPARTELSIANRGGRIDLSISPLPNLPGELHSERELGLVAPALVYDPDVILPLEGRLTRATPRVIVQYVVEADGSTGRFEVLEAPSEQILRSAVDLVSVRRYRPGTIRTEAVAVEYIQGVSFVGQGETIPGLEGIATVADPVFPFERLLANEEGRAKVRFAIAPSGEVQEVAVLEASHPDFGGALAAAAETWVFSAESAQEKPEREFEYEFTMSRVPYGARRLAEQLRGGGEISNRAAGLDQRPKLLARPGLVYPRALLAGAVAGSAEIEFVIDCSGLAQVPRVVKASAPEFGWAALTCVNGMRFAPMSRAGKPTELRVLLPLSFKPPEAEAAAP